MEKIRLQKYISECGVMSRRKAEEEIEAGHIKINGIVAKIGDKVDPASDAVEYKGAVIEKKTDKKIYIALNKPRGYVTTLSDEKGRRCITDLLTDLNERVYPVGRLDLDSEGLILLTNDGELANKLMHPSHHVEKTYYVKTKTVATPAQLRALNGKMTIDGYELQPVQVSVVENRDGLMLKFILHEGRNRQIRKMCDKVGLEVARLSRVSIGKIKCAGIKPGTWVYLNRQEIEYLKSL